MSVAASSSTTQSICDCLARFEVSFPTGGGVVAEPSFRNNQLHDACRFLDKVLVSLVTLRLSDAKAAKIANAATLPP
jgi:hypothetical protein